jgi:hypothetical protein
MESAVTSLGRVAEHVARELEYSREVRCQCTACLEMARVRYGLAGRSHVNPSELTGRK